MSKKYWTETQASSKKDDWETPQQLFDKLNDRHDFNLDAAATDENAKLANYYTIEDDALRQKWGGECLLIRHTDVKLNTGSRRPTKRASNLIMN